MDALFLRSKPARLTPESAEEMTVISGVSSLMGWRWSVLVEGRRGVECVPRREAKEVSCGGVMSWERKKTTPRVDVRWDNAVNVLLEVDEGVEEGDEGRREDSWKEDGKRVPMDGVRCR